MDMHPQVRTAMDQVVGDLTRYLTDNVPAEFHAYALAESGATDEMLGSEEHEFDTRVYLYYEILTQLNIRALAETITRSRAFSPAAMPIEQTARLQKSLANVSQNRDYRGAVPHGTDLHVCAMKDFPPSSLGKIVRFRYNGFPDKLVTLRGFVQEITTMGIRLGAVEVDGQSIEHNYNVEYNEIVPGTLVWE